MKRTAVMVGVGILCFMLAFGLVMRFSGRFDAGDTWQEAGKLPLPSPSAAVHTAVSPALAPAPSAGTLPETQPVSTSVPEQKWVVYVTGAVRRPGIVEVPPGARVFNAVERAGGLNEAADTEGINMAAMLSDGAHVKVPVIGASGQGASIVTTITAPRGPVDNTSGARVGGVIAIVNMNRATAAELTALPGVGPAIAAAIVDFRDKNGSFAQPEDLLKVRGIGPAKLERMRPHLQF